MRIILTGGGTAGHVNPAIAISEILKSNISDAEIFYVGTPSGMERHLVEEIGYPYYPIRSMGFTRTLSLKNLQALWIAVNEPRKAKKLLTELKPDLVVGTGGYVCWPVLSAAAALGIPCAIHESNAVAGLTVRRLAKRVDSVMLNFAEAGRELHGAKRIVCVGNPLRNGFKKEKREDARKVLDIPNDARLVISFGGSLGAEMLNRAMLELFKKYTEESNNIHHIHGCGRRYFDTFKMAVENEIGALPARIRYFEYLTNMPLLMAAADLVICRAGAMTISEITGSGRASILVPSPNVANDHQTKNALSLQEAGAALLIAESELARLPGCVHTLLFDDSTRKRMEAAAAAFHTIDAERAVYNELMRLLKSKKRQT